MKWHDFVDPSDNVYSMRHLHDAEASYRLPPTIMRKASDVSVRVTYGLHCFTTQTKAEQPRQPGWVYFKNPEDRDFCTSRWSLSKDLPRIVSSLLERNCFPTNRKNHVLFSNAQTAGGEEYAVFFVLSKAAAAVNWDANLMIISAHPRFGFRPGTKPLKFRELLRATL